MDVASDDDNLRIDRADGFDRPEDPRRPKKMKTSRTVLLALFMTTTAAAVMRVEDYPKAKVSYDDFKGLVAEVEKHRAERLVNLDTFLEMSKREGVIVLDTRSTFRFERIHIKGARHLSFPDFTQDNLARVVPSFDATILIYCNNNFEGDPIDFAAKTAAIPSRTSPTEQVAAQSKPLMLALNVPTYINLYGYGYRNVYELDELVDVEDPRITFEGSLVD